MLGGLVENDSETGDVDIKDRLTLVGAGAGVTLLTEQSGGVERIIDVSEDAFVVISDLTIHGVFTSSILSLEEECGGGIRNLGDLTAFRVTVSDNTFRRAGGGVCNRRIIRLSDAVIDRNTAALTGPGGGIYNDGYAVLERLMISLNRADTTGGGGIANYGSMIVRDSVITGNSTGGQASGSGGIDNRMFVDGGSLAIINTTISGNESHSRGGGISNQQKGVVTVVNSTVTGNTSSNPVAGGISTDSGSTTTLVNTIVAANSNSDCPLEIGFFVAPISGGHNLDSDGSCQLSGPGDQPNADPMLGELEDNGGPTLTHALLAGSPAIDAGDDSECPGFDQRGAPRPAGAACDIGAYEAGSEVPPPPELVPGDTDCDGAVTPFDALAILRFIGGLLPSQAPGCPEIGQPAGAQTIFGDIDCDGAIDAIDALQILRYLGALPVNLPEDCPPIGFG
jgi:hypothetical protein